MRPVVPKSARPGYPESPCIDTCTLDKANVCMGCGRALEEIVAWSQMSAEQQWAVVRRLKARQ